MRLKVVRVFLLVTILCCAYSLYSPILAPQFFAEYIAIAKQVLVRENGKINHVMFVPGDKVKSTLLGLIYSEQKSICASLYRLSDRDVAFALSHARDRGIPIKIIVDSGALFDKNEKITMLESKGVLVRSYKKSYACMHNKILIFEKNFEQKPILWTGSANATFSGLTRNEENVFITDDKKNIAQHKEKFENLWKELAPNPF